MFHKVKAVQPLCRYILRVQFSEGCTKDYDALPLIEKHEAFHRLAEDPALFPKASIDVGGYGVVFDDDLDISCDELWSGGTSVETPSIPPFPSS